MSDLPQAESADPDGVQVALQAAHMLWSRGDTTESLRWLRRAAESASDEGADVRSLQLAKAAAELRGKLFGAKEEAPASMLPPLPGDDGGAQLGEPAHEAQSHASRGAPVSSQAPASSSLASDSTRSSWGEENVAPGSVRPVVTATQYPSQYPSHRPRQLMGLSSTTLETAVQRDGSSFPAVPSWSADSERRASPSAPPPLPRAAVDDYEELEAEPDDDDPAEQHAGEWSSKPPPLPSAAAYADDQDDGMRPEQPTVAIPAADESEDTLARAPASTQSEANGVSSSRAPALAPQVSTWDSGSRSPSGQPEVSYSWDFDARAASWGGSGESGDVSTTSDSTPPKLTARVHHQAVRVSFTPDPHAPGQYVVRPLREGERPLAGERVALLVALEPGQPLV